ncbi:MAG: hypothetical protein LBR27_04165 [Bifidobacteriaceae bacterium]|jgi:hypothetical protein|nr:hypothetical protein [Bifidobacteriaceae bacterium]
MKNKQLLALAAGVALLGALVAGCGQGNKASGAGKGSASATASASAAHSASPSASPSAASPSPSQAASTAPATPSATATPEPSPTPSGKVVSDGSDRVCEDGAATTAPCQAIVFETTTQTKGESTVEVVDIFDGGGFSHSEEVNAYLQEFFLFPVSSDQPDNTVYTVKAAYALYNDRLSVRAYTTAQAPDAAYPTTTLTAQVFDLSTGQTIPFSQVFPAGDSGDIRDALTSGIFKQVYPETAVDGAAETVAKAVIDEAPKNDSNYYYAVEGGQVKIGLFVDNQPHAEGDYFAFEGPVGD